MEIPQSDYEALVAENKEMAGKLTELIDLRSAFLVNVTKLGKIAAAFCIQADLPDTETQPFFTRAIDERLKRESMLRQEITTLKDTLMILRKIAQGADEQTRLYRGPEDDARIVEKALRNLRPAGGNR